MGSERHGALGEVVLDVVVGVSLRANDVEGRIDRCSLEVAVGALRSDDFTGKIATIEAEPVAIYHVVDVVETGELAREGGLSVPDLEGDALALEVGRDEAFVPKLRDQ